MWCLSLLFGFLLLFVGFRRSDDFAAALVRGSILHIVCAIIYYILEAPLWIALSPLVLSLFFVRLNRGLVTTALAVIMIYLTFSHLFLSKVKSTDDFEIARAVSIYPVPDHVLQWYVSDNFYKKLPLETGFNPDKKQLWSVGDRPIFLGLLNAWIGKILEHSKEQYFLRIIFLSSLLWVFINQFLIGELGIKNKVPRILILLTLLTSPFFITNTIYTWPKLASMTYIFAALTLFRVNPILGGISAALAVLCHSGGQFGVLFIILWFLKDLLKERRIYKFLVAFFLVTIPHNIYLKENSNQTGLYHRVILCREGSYAFPTPVITLKEACLKYYQKVGLSGVIKDRIESFKKAFFDGYKRAPHLIRNVFDRSVLREWYISILSYPSFSYGIFSLFIGVFFCFFKEVRLIALGFSLLGLFSALLAESSVMVAHGIPYIIQTTISLGVLFLLYRIRPIFYLYCALSIALNLGISSFVPQLWGGAISPFLILLGSSVLLSMDWESASLIVCKRLSK
mgnify:CR=1 FL=1